MPWRARTNEYHSFTARWGASAPDAPDDQEPRASESHENADKGAPDAEVRHPQPASDASLSPPELVLPWAPPSEPVLGDFLLRGW